jgi:hypothetical protein
MYLVPRAGAGPTTLHPCKITLKSGHVYGPTPFAAEGFGQPIQLDARDLLGFYGPYGLVGRIITISSPFLICSTGKPASPA